MTTISHRRTAPACAHQLAARGTGRNSRRRRTEVFEAATPTVRWGAHPPPAVASTLGAPARMPSPLAAPWDDPSAQILVGRRSAPQRRRLAVRPQRYLRRPRCRWRGRWAGLPEGPAVRLATSCRSGDAPALDLAGGDHRLRE